MSAENDIQSAAVLYAKKRGLVVRRNYMGPGAETGWPDVEVFFPMGRVLFMEFKVPGAELRKRQEYIISLLRNLDHTVHVCDSLEDAKQLIDAYYRAVS